MSTRATASLSLAVATLAALGTLTLAYGLVYPAASSSSKLSIAAAVFGGALLVAVASSLALWARRHAAQESELFLSLLALSLSVFFLFVVVLGLGIPALVLGVHD
ncbi:MAG TPA: hypothetical protein VFK05_32860 [Polyangiaceae bacterium]|nr:hypothetical protein [Polyangiaceae bacterium]